MQRPAQQILGGYKPIPLLGCISGKSIASTWSLPIWRPRIPKLTPPHFISIGPYHCREPHLLAVEEHKARALQRFLDRTQKRNLDCNETLGKSMKSLWFRISRWVKSGRPMVVASRGLWFLMGFHLWVDGWVLRWLASVRCSNIYLLLRFFSPLCSSKILINFL